MHQRSDGLDRTVRVQTDRIIVVWEKFIENEEVEHIALRTNNRNVFCTHTEQSLEEVER